MILIDPKKFDFQYQGKSNACAAFAAWHVWKMLRPLAAATITPSQLHKLEQVKRYGADAPYDPRKSSAIPDVLNAMVKANYISGYNRIQGASLIEVKKKLDRKIPLIAHLFSEQEKRVTVNHAVAICGYDNKGLIVLDSILRLARTRTVKPEEVFLVFELIF